MLELHFHSYSPSVCLMSQHALRLTPSSVTTPRPVLFSTPHTIFFFFLTVCPLDVQQSLKEGLTVQERMKLFEAKDSKKIWLWWKWTSSPLPASSVWPHCRRCRAVSAWDFGEMGGNKINIYEYIYIYIKYKHMLRSMFDLYLLLWCSWAFIDREKHNYVSALFKIFIIHTHAHTHTHKYTLACPCLTCHISWK